ncbi:hypothetical protein FQA39_LY13277 [Lamprigera yunnana]|nr:hypothetical protein FQA39_LY13277 [Lamprigera yunnana]
MSVFLILLAVLFVNNKSFGAPLEDYKVNRNTRDLYDDNIILHNKACDCVCGGNNRQVKVVGGNITKVNEFPWLAGLSKGGEFFCGATVITKKHLLTAAHCVNGMNYHAITVAFGDHDRKDKDRFKKIQVRRIKKISAHKLFDKSSYNNDIAILELDSPLYFDSQVQPACIPNNALTDYSGKWAVVAGWGRTGEKEDTSTILKKAVVPIWAKKDCYNSGYGEDRLSENMFCAGHKEGKIDACQGDSGGPLQTKNQAGVMDVIGVVSWGRGCGRPNLPGIYTKINTSHPVLPVYPKINRNNTSATGRLYFNEIIGLLGGGTAATGDDEDDGLFRNCTCECGVTNEENRIVGGRPTGVNRYPWIARLVYDGLFHCGGSLITQDYVLTAAHCVRRLKRTKIRVILGDHDQTTMTDAPAKMRAVSAIIKNRNFDADSYNHDIALLRLRKPVVFSKNIKPICVPRVSDDPAGKIGTVIGWGRTMEGGMLPGIVQEVQVPILTLQQCRAMKYRASKITSYMLCAGKGTMDSCQGDSGGPLVVPVGEKYEIVACGVRNDASRIVGGQTTAENEFPWVCRLSYFNRFYCGGMLINDRYVLTAAHCVKGFMWFMIKVTFGEHSRCDDSKRPESRYVMRAITGAFSFLHFDNDIALLRLNDRVPITDAISPVCLPKDRGGYIISLNASLQNLLDELYVGRSGIAAGWGTLQEDGKPSCFLQEVEVPILSNEACRKTNYSEKMITDNMMCAGYPEIGGKDSCQGDSGGPFVTMRPDKRYELIGVVSWGNGCARPNYPGVYTRVANYLDWILENSADGCFCEE